MDPQIVDIVQLWIGVLIGSVVAGGALYFVGRNRGQSDGEDIGYKRGSEEGYTIGKIQAYKEFCKRDRVVCWRDYAEYRKREKAPDYGLVLPDRVMAQEVPVDFGVMTPQGHYTARKGYFRICSFDPEEQRHGIRYALKPQIFKSVYEEVKRL